MNKISFPESRMKRDQLYMFHDVLVLYQMQDHHIGACMYVCIQVSVCDKILKGDDLGWDFPVIFLLTLCLPFYLFKLFMINVLFIIRNEK